MQEVLFPQPLWDECLPQAEQKTGEHAGKLQEIRVVCHLDFSDRSPWSVSVFKAVVFVHEINAAVCESVCLHDTVKVILEVKLNGHRTEAQLQVSMTP